MTNTGNSATGQLTVALSGTNASSFTVSPTTISNIIDSTTIKLSPVANLSAGNTYSATITITGSNGISASKAFSLRITGAQYIITQPDSNNLFSYTAKKGTLTVSEGRISDVLSAIRQDADEKAAIIIFDAGDDEVNLASAIIFENSSVANTKKWGPVEIQGKIFSTNDDSVFGAVVVDDPISLTSYAEIRSEGGGDSNVIYSKSSGAVNIEGGSLSAKFGRVIANKSSGAINVKAGTVATLVKEAILNDADGSVVVTGGTVSATTGRAILNNSTGTVTIKDGATIIATQNSGIAIKNDSSGKIIVEGGLVTSENTINDQGTIVLATYSYVPATDDDPAVDELLKITGGKVDNTINQGRAIYNNTTGKISISDNAVVESLKTDGFAIWNQKKAPLDISGGTVSAAAGTAINNADIGVITISGGLVQATTGRAIVTNKKADPTTDESDDNLVIIAYFATLEH